MAKKRLTLTHRISKLFGWSLLLALSLASCMGQGTDQLHGMYDLSFSSTAVCNSQIKLISFRNVSDQEIVIAGVAVSIGTDPDQNFYLESVLIGGQEQPSASGTFTDLHIPVGASYSFKVHYSPKQENKSNSALLDIAYQSPQQGIIQVALEGNSTSKSNNCPEEFTGGEVGLQGDLFFRVKKMVAATSLIGGTIDTDQGTVDFQPFDMPITLTINDSGGGTVTLPAVTGDDFALPPPGESAPSDIRQAGITHPTIVTIHSESSGTYDPSVGQIVINSVPVQMSGDFEAKLNITLTTEVLKNTLGVRKDALSKLGSLWDTVNNELHGQRINADDENSVILIGFASVFDVVASGTLSTLEGNSMAVVIFGNIIESE